MLEVGVTTQNLKRNDTNEILGVLVLEGFVGRHRTVQLQFTQHDWSRHRLGLL